MPAGINTRGAGRVPGAGGCASGKTEKVRGLNLSEKTKISLDFVPQWEVTEGF